MKLEAVIFDLDGVLVHTDRFHYLAWKQLADEEGIPFDESINHFLRGVSRLESLEIIIKPSKRLYTDEEKWKLAERKNDYYRTFLNQLTPADTAQDTVVTLSTLKAKGIKIGIGSSSKNAQYILERIGLSKAFDAVVTGMDIVNGKPDPEVFKTAAERLRVPYESCLVVEDAEAGMIAAKRASMYAAAIGAGLDSEHADYHLNDLTELITIISHYE